MNYKMEIIDYIKSLNKGVQRNGVQEVLRLQQEGYDNIFIYTALTAKSPYNWNKYGFGLLHKQDYLDQIQKQLEAPQYDVDDLMQELFDDE